VSGSLWLWIALLSLALGGLFATLQLCLREASRGILEDRLENGGSPGAKTRMRRILGDLQGHSISVALPRVVFNLFVLVALMQWIGSMGVAADADPSTPPAPQPIGPGAIAAAVGGGALLIWAFGMVIPWTIAEHAAESTVWIWSRLIRATCVLLSPIIVLARLIEEIVRRLLGARPTDDTERHEAELLSVVEEGERAGEFDETERDMIEAVVEFRSRNVDQIMTPRTEIRAMALTDNLGEVTQICREIGHSRIPVFEDDLDHIVGIFYVKDLLRWLADDRENGSRHPFSLREIVREAVFVPETKTVRELLVELLARRVHIAMVADEYGGTAGLVTIEDIVEEVFGEIQDEYESPDEAQPGVTLNSETREADIDARAYIDDANDELEPLGVALPESEEYDTVGGFVVTALGRIPDEGETLHIGGAVMTVLDAQPTRVIKLRLAVVAESETEALADRVLPPLGEALHNGHSDGADQRDPGSASDQSGR